MEKAKTFFFVCAGILMLAAATNLSVGNAQANEREEEYRAVCIIDDPTMTNSSLVVLFSNGDIYGGYGTHWTLWGNPIDETVAQSTDWSQLKTNFGK